MEFNVFPAVFSLGAAICAARTIGLHICYDGKDKNDAYQLVSFSVTGLIFLAVAIACSVFSRIRSLSGFELTVYDLPPGLACLGGILLFGSFILTYARNGRNTIAYVLLILGIFCFIASVVVIPLCEPSVGCHCIGSPGL